MRVIRDAELSPTPCAATIGFFDGVHRGHRFLLEQVKAAAEARGLSSLAITFSTHPRSVLQPGFSPQLLTPFDEKLDLLADTGIGACAVLAFTHELAAQSAETFMQTIATRYGVRCLVIGHDHRFGCNRTDGFEDYVRHGARCGIEVIASNPLEIDGFIVSSSVVRRFLAAGDVQSAAHCLGRPYDLTGTVTEGRQVGRSIGFPTANLQPEHPHLLVPKNGVYAARALSRFGTHAAMVNIGQRPTLDNGNDTSIEAHLLHFSENLYGERLTLEFIDRIRDEKKFESIDALRDRLLLDAQTAENCLRP